MKIPPYTVDRKLEFYVNKLPARRIGTSTDTVVLRSQQILLVLVSVATFKSTVNSQQLTAQIRKQAYRAAIRNIFIRKELSATHAAVESSNIFYGIAAIDDR